MSAQEASPHVYRIVLTGGPCGGKTTALTRLRDRVEALGFRVFLVPETATLLAGGGVPLGDIPRSLLIRHEGNLMAVHLALEDSFFDIARAADRPAVVFCDRGALDYAAYMPTAAWQALLDERGWTPVGLYNRYDAVIHLVTAAIGAEAAYTTANNAARTETPEQARALDERTRQAWVGHPHLHVVDNRTGFEDKIRRVLDAVCAHIGAPAPARQVRKFLVSPCPALPVHHVELLIELTCLRTSDASEARLRRRGQGGSYVYAHTRKLPAGGNVVERPLSGRDYFEMLAQADPDRRPVTKFRRCFLLDDHYFELDEYREPVTGMSILQVEVPCSVDVHLPPFLRVLEEVTDDWRYTTAGIASGSLR
jgi:predicted ATPase